ncbi:hypothetical protein ASE28_17405 [Acidovorax sp. Root219]|nr:hypothetical protein ASE28_17405 [Acidovorax sp. Root219]
MSSLANRDCVVFNKQHEPLIFDKLGQSRALSKFLQPVIRVDLMQHIADDGNVCKLLTSSLANCIE